MGKFIFNHKWNETWLFVINWYIRVASRVAELLKTCNLRELENIRKMSKLHRIIAYWLVLFPIFCEWSKWYCLDQKRSITVQSFSPWPSNGLPVATSETIWSMLQNSTFTQIATVWRRSKSAQKWVPWVNAG